MADHFLSRTQPKLQLLMKHCFLPFKGHVHSIVSTVCGVIAVTAFTNSGSRCASVWVLQCAPLKKASSIHCLEEPVLNICKLMWNVFRASTENLSLKKDLAKIKLYELRNTALMLRLYSLKILQNIWSECILLQLLCDLKIVYRNICMLSMPLQMKLMCSARV